MKKETKWDKKKDEALQVLMKGGELRYEGLVFAQSFIIMYIRTREWEVVHSVKGYYNMVDAVGRGGGKVILNDGD